MSEAAKENVVPSDASVSAYYSYQQKLFQETMPQGKDYETTQREQGVTPDETKNNLKTQLAEMALYAKKMNVTDADIRKIYDKANGQFGLPARVLMRLILVAPNSPDFAHAKQLLDAKTDFAQVAKTVNVPQLKGNGGLLPNYTMMNQIAPQLQQQVAKSSTGDVIGPIDYKFAANQPPAKAWIKIEDKRPPYNIAFDDAAPLIRQQLVQVQIQQPQFASIRNDIIKQKLDASFEPTDASYTTVWNSIKKSAEDAGIGQSAPVAAPNAAPAPVGAGAPAPAAVPSAK
jgi:foldase protein PrsA